MQNDKFKKILFLCTGNYFRSRFAEEYFNARAAELQLFWQSFSRGVRQNIAENLRPEPISPYTVQGLQARAMQPQNTGWPQVAQPHDFAAARIIALCEREHKPYIAQHYAQFLPKIEWWHIEDIDRVPPQIAISLIAVQVETLLQKLTE